MSSPTLAKRNTQSDNLFCAVDAGDPAASGNGDVVADFVAAAREWPHRAAIACNGSVVDYRQLAERVGAMATRLREKRPGTGGLTGVLVSHTPSVVESLLGILHAGGVYCPIDATLPAGRRDTLAAALSLDPIDPTALDHSGPTAGVADTDLQQASSRPADPAYVLFTSGSTGTPKPVVVSRHALTTAVRALRQLFALTPDDRVLQFASLAWDTCFEEILPALTAGATLVFDDAAQSGSFPRFVRMLGERGVTVLDLPTAFWHELVLFLHDEQAVLPDCVRLVVIGGERVDPTRLRQWRNCATAHIRLLNTYGCTETTLVTHAVQLNGPGTAPDVANAAEAPIGHPLPHVREHVTDEGELLVSGSSLATGYLGMAELTRAGFPVTDFGSGPARWFRTGDVVRRGERGLLYALGRADEQVKVLGVRVHPAEVEAQLNTHSGVAGAVVVGERRLGRTALTAYVVPVGTPPPTSAELRQYLRDRLPGQFVPSRVKFIAALSYTASGKVDREATRRAAEDDDTRGVGR